MPLYSGKDSTYKVRTLLDSGAGHSWITGKLLKHVNYTRMPTQRLTIATLNGSVNRRCQLVQVYFHTHTLVPIECFVLDDFVEHIMVYGLKKFLSEETSLSRQIIANIVDPAEENIDHAALNMGTGLVLSNAAMASICPKESTRVILQEHRLIIEPTIFGLALSGEIPARLQKSTRVVQAMCSTPKLCDKVSLQRDPEANIHDQLGYHKEVLEDEVSFLWDKANLGIFSHEVHDEDRIATQRLEESMVQSETGQYEVKLPFNAKLPMLKPNREMAVARTHRQMTQMAEKETYRNLMIKAKEELELCDYIETVTPNIIPVQRTHFLPWRGVVKIDSETTKLRLVMDASAKKSASDVSLNQCLYQGPNMILNLAKCLIRFMFNKFRCVADIEKAFLRIVIAVEDRDVLRFFWPQDPCNPKSRLIEYRWKALLFGSISSPFILATVLKRLITDNSQSQYTKDALLKGIYVDNLFHSDNNQDKLANFFDESRMVLAKAKFNLREWSSNSQKVQEKASQQGVFVRNEKVNALGLLWNQVTDQFSFKTNFAWNFKYTKRSVLSFTNAAFDPLNWICPIHIQNRLFIRDLWALLYKWDQSFSNETELVERWTHLRNNCFKAMGVVMDLNVQIRDSTQIHIFCDASTQAYGAVIYVVTPASEMYPNGEVWFIKAKGKITPVLKNPKEDTVPRWELCSVVLASNLWVFVVDAMPQLREKQLFLWNDNRPALAWLSQTEIRDTYVHNRVRDVRERCPTATILHVPTKDNPADVLTRDISAEDLLQCRQWWRGPIWITDHNLWPVSEQVYNLHPPILPQHNNVVIPDSDNPLRVDLPVLHIFQDHRFKQNLRKLAWILRWKHRMQGTNRFSGKTVDANELAVTKIEAIKIMQKNSFPQELEDLKKKGFVNQGRCKKLRLILDQDGVIRCQSRVQYTLSKDPRNSPILMDTNSDLTASYIKNIHVQNNCGTKNFTLNYARQEIHAIRLVNLVKQIIGKCKVCMRYRCHPYRYPIQPILPLERTLKDSPFSACGTDLFGPYNVLKQNTSISVWVCLFSCMKTRAIYMVVLEDLKSTSFLTALKELSTRRCQPKVLISDNATNFTHASKILTYLAKRPEIKRDIADQGIEWRFIPAKAPWQGALYERLIKIIKQEICKLCKNDRFTLKDFKSHLIEVEFVVNSRPLCRSENEEIITPRHLLDGIGEIRGCLLSNPTADITLDRILEYRKDLPKYYQDIKDRKEVFWKALQTQYLQSLKFAEDKMGNQFKTVPKVNDVCLIYDPDIPRLRWKEAVIKALIVSEDKEIRACVIETDTGETTRPVNHLFKLELDIEDHLENNLQVEQSARAQRHAGPIKELKDKVKKAAQDTNMPNPELQQLIQRLDQPELVNLDRRPRRQAALNAAQQRQQLIRDNAL